MSYQMGEGGIGQKSVPKSLTLVKTFFWNLNVTV